MLLTRLGIGTNGGRADAPAAGRP